MSNVLILTELPVEKAEALREQAEKLRGGLSSEYDELAEWTFEVLNKAIVDVGDVGPALRTFLGSAP